MKRSTARIREVWASNLEEEVLKLSLLIDHFPYIAMDTEFPGVVVRLVAHDGPDTTYQTLRGNVDLLKIIQLGLTLSDADGQSPPDCTTWQFNFAFSLSTDMYAQDSIDLLTDSGIDFAAHERDGIDVLTFGELLTSSGLVINPLIKWVSFHGGYDFAYLVKVLTAVALPDNEADFFDILHIYFPTLYDLKYLMIHADHLFGGLNKVAELLGCERVGTMHQAGSDSLLTMDVFFRMRDSVFHGDIEPAKEGVLFGLGTATPLLSSASSPQRPPASKLASTSSSAPSSATKAPAPTPTKPPPSSAAAASVPPGSASMSVTASASATSGPSGSASSLAPPSASSVQQTLFSPSKLAGGADSTAAADGASKPNGSAKSTAEPDTRPPQTALSAS